MAVRVTQSRWHSHGGDSDSLGFTADGFKFESESESKSRLTVEP